MGPRFLLTKEGRGFSMFRGEPQASTHHPNLLAIYTYSGIVDGMETLNSAAIVAQIRQATGLTQRDLASKAGTSQPAVARYETGVSHPSTETLERLARAAGFEIQVQLVPTKPRNLASARAKKLFRMRSEVLTVLSKAGATNARLFGSVARGEDTVESDIDLLVDFDLHRGLVPILHLNEDLSNLLDEKVEVSIEELLLPKVLATALADAVPL